MKASLQGKANTPKARGTALHYLEITEAGLETWFWHEVDGKKTPLEEVRKELAVKGIVIPPHSLWQMVLLNRVAYNTRQALQEMLREGLSASNEHLEKMARERLATFMVLNASMKPKDVVDAMNSLLRARQVEVQRIEAMAKLYRVQMESAQLLANVFREKDRLEQLEKLAADRTMTGLDTAKAIRLIVYGKNAAPEPDGEMPWSLPEITDGEFVMVEKT